MSDQAQTLPAQPAETALTLQPASVTESLVRGELHQQVMLARQFPREVGTAIQKMEESATLTADVAEECFYNLNQGGEQVEGPSIRFAEIAAAHWGNLRTATRTIDIDTKAQMVTVQGICHDTESGNVQMVEAHRSIRKRNGETYAHQMILKTLDACHSIARRNAILAVVPRALTNPIVDRCKVVAAGTQASLADRRKKALDYLESKGVSQERVLAALGCAEVADMTGKHVARLRGIMSAIKEGETDIETQFPPVEEDGPRRKQATTPPAGGPPAAEGQPEPQTAQGERAASASPAAESAPRPAATSTPPASNGGASPARQQATPAQQGRTGDVIDVTAEPVDGDQGDMLGNALGEDTGDADQPISQLERGRLKLAAKKGGKNLDAILQEEFGTNDLKQITKRQLTRALELLA